MQDQELKDFAALVGEMRKAQNHYFTTRSVAALVNAKELEKRVDRMINSILKK